MRSALVLIVLAAGSQAWAAEPLFRRLTGKQISARLVGMTITDDTHWRYTFKRNGHLSSFALGRSREGTWRVENDRLCATNGPGSAECHEVWISSDAVELRREGASPEVGMLVRFTREQMLYR